MPEVVCATAGDRVVLRGELTRGRSSTWLVLIHDAGGDLDDWRPLIAGLGESGWNLVAFDLRGHGGSDGEDGAAAPPADVDAALTFARRAGAEHVCVIAAGSGAIAALGCAAAALDDPSAGVADSLVLLSPGPLGDRNLSGLRGEGLPKLIIASSVADQQAVAQALMQVSIGWTVRVAFATEDRGTALLAGPFAGHVADRIGSFVREQETLTGADTGRGHPLGVNVGV